jgi:hypothetical protein
MIAVNLLFMRTSVRITPNPSKWVLSLPNAWQRIVFRAAQGAGLSHTCRTVCYFVQH